MPESLLTPTDILLFGRRVTDIEIKRPKPEGAIQVEAVSTNPPMNFAGAGDPANFDGVEVPAGCLVLVARPDPERNGVYKVEKGDWERQPSTAGDIVSVKMGNNYAGSLWEAVEVKLEDGRGFEFTEVGTNRSRGNKLLQSQLNDDRACFARIYGFSYQGSYFDLPTPVLFLVHNDGNALTPDTTPPNFSESRAPHGPTFSGVGAADFQFSDDIRVWSYDKADWTIRMDVDTGTFEQMLLDIYFSGDDGSPLMVSGGRVSGGRVSGGRVSGGRVSGGRVSGGRAKGPSD